MNATGQHPIEGEHPRRSFLGTMVAPETLLAAGFFIGAWLLMHVWFWTLGHDTSTGEYREYGDAILHGRIPYRDFAVEYPPGALVSFVIPSLFRNYVHAFEGFMLACGLGIVVLVSYLRRAGLALIVVSPLLVGPSLLTGRFDLWPTVIATAAIVALLVDRNMVACALLGAAVATKLWPIVIAPIVVAWIWKRTSRRQAISAACVGIAIPVLTYAPFVALAPGGVWQSIHDQMSRPLQVESLGAAALIEAGAHIRVVNTFGSQNLAGPGVGVITLLLTLAQIGSLLLISALFARGPATRERIIRHSASAVAAFVAFDKVLSPQYVIWLIPFVAVVVGRRHFVAWSLLIATLVLTQWYYPRHYPAYGLHLHRDVGVVVLGRDVLLVVLAAALVWVRRPQALFNA